LPKSVIRDWGASPSELEAAVKARLLRDADREWEQLEPGLWASPWRNHEDASRLFVPELVQKLKVKGKPVALCPRPTVLLVTGSEDPDGLAAMYDTANMHATAAEPEAGPAEDTLYQDLHGAYQPLLICDGGQWRTWYAERHHPGLGYLGNCWRLSRFLGCVRQKLLLESLFGADDCRTCSLLLDPGDAAAESAQGRVHAWTIAEEEIEVGVARLVAALQLEHEGARSSEYLVPEADDVVLVDHVVSEKPLGIVTWERFVAVCGARMRASDEFWPKRWSLAGYPTQAEIEALALEPLAAGWNAIQIDQLRRDGATV
jgi:hypothetical protein